MDKLLLTSEEAAEQLGVSRTHFYSLNSSGQLGPMAIKLGECSRWSYAELKAWVDAGCPAREQWLRISNERAEKN